MFSVFCTEQLGFMPRIAHPNGIKRLGKVNGDNPRKMIVHLESEVAAAEILEAAKFLRNSEDNYVARKVFINLDLSKEEAKEAYLRRQQRRQGLLTAAVRPVENRSPTVIDNIKGVTALKNVINNTVEGGVPSISTPNQLPYHNTSKSKVMTFTNSYRYGTTNLHPTTSSSSSNPSNLIVCSGASASLNPNAPEYPSSRTSELMVIDESSSMSSIPYGSSSTNA